MNLRISIITTLLVTLGSCTLPGTQSESDGTIEGMISFQGSGFSMDIPANWSTKIDKNLPTPKNGAIVLTALSPEVRYGFSNNILILEDSLDQPVTSKKYSEMNQVQTTRNYLEYTKISDEAILFDDSDESRVHIFEARYNTTTSRMKFIQSAKVCGTKVYLIHAAVALDKQTPGYIDIFRTFKCN